ncbi:response regulator transcription factor [Paenibacillus glycanilyticus]|uniref:response regulator transcription factor n=1 Tax=Paenibacillus glycanilyticus TaxID=126569 RepID=UPI0020424651|nr:response regulator transcription factor [Paenibacillus glycanilyticus]MCM3629333.1 response regulator transcription factor [Paenibacillus glycanilyticus]
MEKILIVEDDVAISDLIRLNLEIAGYDTRQAFNGSEALELIDTYAPNLILLDVNLPEKDGFEIMEELESSNLPVILLTARGSLADKVKGLRMGADDYIVKPFESMELLARIEAVLRRYGVKHDHLVFGDLEINLEERIVRSGNRVIDLTMKEFELLLLLIRNKNKAMSRERILELVWGYEYMGETRTVDIHIQKIRKKLKLEDYIKTVYKFGYRLEDHQ